MNPMGFECGELSFSLCTSPHPSLDIKGTGFTYLACKMYHENFNWGRRRLPLCASVATQATSIDTLGQGSKRLRRGIALFDLVPNRYNEYASQQPVIMLQR